MALYTRWGPALYRRRCLVGLAPLSCPLNSTLSCPFSSTLNSTLSFTARLSAARLSTASPTPRSPGLLYEQQLYNSVENVSANLEKNDRLAYLLAQYIPEPARNAYLGIRAFALEVNKISDGLQMGQHAGVSTAAMKLKFWSDMISKAFSGSPAADLGEPTVFLLRDAVANGLNLDICYFQQYLQTRRDFLEKQQFASIDAICSYGEGTSSQMNYATQAALLLPHISPSVIHMLELLLQLQRLVSEISAHIGQASALASMILGARYYALKNLVSLPTDVMTNHALLQEDFVRVCQGHQPAEGEVRERLKNVVFDTAVAANDHLLSARAKLLEVQQAIAELVATRPGDSVLAANCKKWRHGLPDVVFTPYMLAYPTALYLERLEKLDFDVFSKKLQHKEWRLAWRSFRGYYLRRI